MVDVRTQIGGGIGRCECPQRRLARQAREEPACAHHRMPRRQCGVHACERTEPRRLPQLVLGTARYVADAVAELRGLLDEEAILDQRTASLEARRERGDAFDIEHGAAPGAEGRVEVVEAQLPFVPGSPRLDDDQPRRKTPVLHGVGIGQHRHRIDRVVGQRDRRQAGRLINQGARAELHAGLARTPAFDAEPARNFDDSGKQA